MTAALTTSPSDSSGFTLVEILMAMLILTVGLLGLLQSVNIAYLHASHNRVREEAVQLAEEQMSDLVSDIRTKGFDSVTSINVKSVARMISGGSRVFRVTTEPRSLGASDSKKLTVSVAWSFHNMSTKHVIYTMKNR